MAEAAAPAGAFSNNCLAIGSLTNGSGARARGGAGMVDQAPVVDVIAVGAGPLVILVHSSVVGARQWRH